MKQTSIEAYNNFRDSGRLTERQLDVLTVMLQHGKPMTGQEVAAKVPGGWKRLSELQKLGAIREVGIRTCSITGEKAVEWAIVEHQPEPQQPSLL